MNYKEILDVQRSIDGMMMEVSAATWCVLLGAQQATWNWHGLQPGDYLEIGTYKGKSASILASFCALHGNKLTIVDPEVRGDARRSLDKILPGIRYLEIPSERLRYGDFHKNNIRSLAFAHIDGMHSFAAVSQDIQLCEEMIGEYGILCVDDFHTELYPQVTASVYNHLYTTTADLVIFLLGFNKVYLCRNSAKEYFYSFVERELVESLGALGHKISLVKNDSNEKFDGLAMAPFQGESYFGNRFRFKQLIRTD